MSNIYYRDVGYKPEESFLHVDPWSKNSKFDGQTLSSLDRNGDSFITFEELGSDKIKFIRMAHFSAARFRHAANLEVLKTRIAREERAREAKTAKMNRPSGKFL